MALESLVTDHYDARHDNRYVDARVTRTSKLRYQFNSVCANQVLTSGEDGAVFGDGRGSNSTEISSPDAILGLHIPRIVSPSCLASMPAFAETCTKSLSSLLTMPHGFNSAGNSCASAGGSDLRTSESHDK
jgi:hypothetical protein